MRARKARVKYICDECSKQYERLACQVRGKKHYCSNACVGRAKQHGSTLYCDLCDTSFYRRDGEQKGTNRSFCSRACYGEWRAINRSPNGYIKRGGVHLHRQVAAQFLGRPLLPGEIVHHLDFDKHNNKPSNLAVLPSQAFHARVHFGEVSVEELRRFSLV